MLHDALIYLAAAVIAVPLFKRLGLGAVLGYLIAGVLIGPSVLRLIDDPDLPALLRGQIDPSCGPGW